MPRASSERANERLSRDAEFFIYELQSRATIEFQRNLRRWVSLDVNACRPYLDQTAGCMRGIRKRSSQINDQGAPPRHAAFEKLNLDVPRALFFAAAL